MDYPNKVYVSEFKGKNSMNSFSHLVIIIAASSTEVAKQYIWDKVGYKLEPVWLMNTVYPTIWDQSGRNPEPIQAKILYKLIIKAESDDYRR